MSEQRPRGSMTADEAEQWRACFDYDLPTAAILMSGGNPSETEDFYHPEAEFMCERQMTDGHPGFTAAFERLKSAIRGGQLRALQLPTTGSSRARDPWDQEPDQVDWRRVDWYEVRVEADELREHLRSRKVPDRFFCPAEEGARAMADDPLDPAHPHFAPELALALRAWLALAAKPPAGAPKAAIREWAADNPQAWVGDPGGPSREALDRIATLVNWRKAGGAPRTGNATP